MMLPERASLYILGVVVICSMPHFFNVEIWVPGACLLIWGYTLATMRHGWRPPNSLGRSILTLVLSALVMISHEGLTIEAFVALLALMISMKLLESRGIRDRMITLIFSYFLIVGSLFFDDSLIATSYMVFSVLYTTAVMIHVNQPEHPLNKALRLSATLMIQALPILLVMFFLFPRIQGGLWGRNPVHSARSGFSDEIRFGTIAQLVESKEVAFRVEFDGEIPKREDLYWRGIVLWQFDGETWRRGKKRRGTAASVPRGVKGVSYSLTLEPHHMHWLFSLDVPVSISFLQTWLLGDHTAYRLKPVAQRVRYGGVSSLTMGASGEGDFPKEGLQLPARGNPQARELALEWSDQAETAEDIVKRGLDYFREQPFSYTLSPGVLADATGDKDRVDRFLFSSRRGFCEHFASSFAFLMRAAGVPARIVGGYHGGEINPYGDYLVVRQSDAHAWCEVWLAEKGWVRIDPTTAVAPLRIQSDMASALPAEEQARYWSFFRTTPLGRWLKTVESGWDLINSRWNRWVMGYTATDQVGLLSRLGLHLGKVKGVAGRFGIFLLVSLPLLLLAGFLLLHRKTEEKDRLAVCWLEFCRKLENVGLVRREGQGPRDYMQHIRSRRPDLAADVEEIVTLYISLRYGENPDSEQIGNLAAMVKGFQPGKRGRR
ncbi:MAG: DUF3488 and transglutaminase-like domain-containing protein [Thermodesulfobacteriota bacterium]